MNRVRTSRRAFMKAAAAATVSVAGGWAAGQDRPALPALEQKGTGGGWIDVNVTLGRWPFRRLPLDQPAALAAKLRQVGVAQAWTGAFDGIFHKDIAGANARLAEECRRHGLGLLEPFGSVNPKLPEWEADLTRCAEEHRMAGIRLHPSYHGYRLDDSALGRLLDLAGERRMIVQIVADMEDERTQHPLGRAPHADFKPFPKLLEGRPDACVVLLNWFRSVPLALAKQIARAGACLDIATVENVGGVASLAREVSTERVLFGSHAPLFYFESAVLKLKESALSAAAEAAIRGGNARRLAPLAGASAPV